MKKTMSENECEHFVCLGCGKIDGNVRVEPNFPGSGDSDELCNECGSASLEDLESGVKKLVENLNQLTERFWKENPPGTEVVPKGTMDAIRNLLNKIQEIENNPSYRSVWLNAQIHLGEYDGPQYVNEIFKLKTILFHHDIRKNKNENN